MESEKQNIFKVGIPGQPFGTTVSYYIVAHDDDKNRTQSRIFSFRVTDTGNGCCGGAALTTNADEDNKLLAGAAILSNLLVILFPWSLIRYFSRKK